MSSSQYDVIVVGAGAAGLSAAIGLARSGFNVIVVESAAYPGAENWSGCVYFCENLAHPDLLGPERVETLAWERRLVERGIFATDGYSLLGMTYRDPKSEIQNPKSKTQNGQAECRAFRHCYTVLRPIYDHHLAQVALRHGVAILTETTAESLIRDGSRVIGVCTQRGPLYADLVFLAEGDASHLVTREGYERFADPRETPKFLQGIKQVIDMPLGAIESIFGLGADEGAAYEILIRNGSLRGRDLHLNMGGFVYTNRQSLSIGLVLALDNLKQNFGGDPNLLMEWFENLPALKPWLREGKRGVFGAKLIRGGGVTDIPQLVDHGLAIGGAASAVGIDFPYPNFTGPATAMGLLLAQAARHIREQGGDFSRDNLAKHYLEPLQKTNYWRDVEFLRRWPGYVKRTEAFFGLNLDLALGTAYVWTRPKRWLPAKWINWLRLLLNVAGPAQWRLLRHDARHLVRSARLNEAIDRPAWIQLVLDGTINAFGDLIGRPRPNLPSAGTIRVHYSVAGGDEPTGPASRLLQRWFRRFSPILGAAAQRVYSNDHVSLEDKLPEAIRLLVRQINLFDVIIAGTIGMAACFTGALIIAWTRFLRLFGWRRSGKPPRGIYHRYALAASQVADMTPLLTAAAQRWEGRLARLAYNSAKKSHIHLLWPRSLPDKNAVTLQGLWHVCPAHVYEARINTAGQLQVVVNFENCIKCETCWRGSDAAQLVDWGRDGRHRFNYAVHSPTVVRLVEAVHAGAAKRLTPPRTSDPWVSTARDLDRILEGELEIFDGKGSEWLNEAYRLLDQLDQKLREFDEALSKDPRTIDRARSDFLEMLARYAQQLASRLQEVFHQSPLAENPTPVQAAVFQEITSLTGALVGKAEERARRTWTQHFFWAAADGRQMRFHHLQGLRRYLDVFAQHNGLPQDNSQSVNQLQPWLRGEEDDRSVADKQRLWSARLDATFPSETWHDRERQVPLTAEQDVLLRDLISQIPALDPTNLENTLHPPLRKLLLAELGRRDPSLAFRVASHLWARDLLHLEPSFWKDPLDHWTRGKEWACIAFMEPIDGSLSHNVDGEYFEAFFIPAIAAHSLLLILPGQIAIVPTDHPGLAIEPLRTLGLRGAGLARVGIHRNALPKNHVRGDGDRQRRIWSILSAADLTSIAAGMADQLCRRAITHASGRVQFPDLFHDEESRDTIGKFGAVKKMIAEMAARRLVIETVSHVLSPADFSDETRNRVGLMKALAAECLGTAPGSIAYNAGQVFGGAGYSEDDILSKFYRDASAWRMLGAANFEILRRHGKALLASRLDISDFGSDFFDSIRQRKALEAELDEILYFKSGMRNLVKDWQRIRGGPLIHPQHGAICAEAEEALGLMDAKVLASQTLLFRIHARLESGQGADLELALLRVWLNDVSISKDEIEARLHRILNGQARDDRPIIHPAAPPPVLTYGDYLTGPDRYESGDFLVRPVDPALPRLVPEWVEADPALAKCNRELRSLFFHQFGKPRQVPMALAGPSRTFENYERYIEHQHRPDPADLDFCREHGFFRMTIPKEQGGEGRPKIDYYLLTTNAQRLADVALSLTIQVNSSIGTTPVLLARARDLPRALKDLEAFIADWQGRKDIQSHLELLLRLQEFPEPPGLARINEAFQTLHHRLEETVFSRAAVRTLTHEFVHEWTQAGRTLREMQWPSVRSHLQAALDAWRESCGRAETFHEELRRRREACDLFLRWVASGQISAFALTEPSAGSDTARLITRAQSRSVPVEEQTDGSFRFVPVGGQGARFLLDARRLEFHNGMPHYRWSANAEPSPVHFEEYDYETDDPDRGRNYACNGRKVLFTDIAQLRNRDGLLWYDYWELTGSKMWITNGRLAGVMCLYARTSEGVTGFMVDRHAEGLFVGKDEAKMGQCGSPTNELSLQAVRVPRENVIGLEGRGQVNALESLNVGRAGLAMSAMAPMEGLIESCRDFAKELGVRDLVSGIRNQEPGIRSQTPDSYPLPPDSWSLGGAGVPDWVQWRLERMHEAHFTAEALAYEIIGRFEHPGTGSVRMESAIAKMLTSELLHEVIDRAEEIYGLAGQTELHLIEKRKRDARVLTIYEGTNEIQRFFILKDLASEVAPRWKNAMAFPMPHLGREALEFESLKLQFRQRVDQVVELFGQELWQNPNLQANCFLLSEAAAWLKAADSTLARLAWLEHEKSSEDQGSKMEDQRLETDQSGTADPSPILDSRSSLLHPSSSGIGRRALARCYDEVRIRLKRFDEELMHLRRGYYAPEIRAASLLFQEAGRETESGISKPPQAGKITKPLSILVVMEATAANIPFPQVVDGRLLEPYLPLSQSSRSALETALRIRDQASAPVTIEVISVGPAGTAQVLREPLSLGVDRVRLLVLDAEAVTPASAAAELSSVLGAQRAFDLILGGEERDDQEDGLLICLLAQALHIPFAGSASQLLVGGSMLSRPLEGEDRAPDRIEGLESIALPDALSEAQVLLTDSAGRIQRSRTLPLALAVDQGLPLREFTTAGYLAGLGRNVELIRWHRKVGGPALELTEGLQLAASNSAPTQSPAGPLTPGQAASHVFQELGLDRISAPPVAFQRTIEDVVNPTLLGAGRPRGVGVIAADCAGRLHPSAFSVLKAVRLLGATLRAEPVILLMAPPEESLQRQVVAQCLASGRCDIVLLSTPAADLSPQIRGQMLIDCWPDLVVAPRAVVGEPWTELALAALVGRTARVGSLALRIRQVLMEQGRIILMATRAGGKLQTRLTFDSRGTLAPWISLIPECEIQGAGETVGPTTAAGAVQPVSVHRWKPRLERFFVKNEIQRMLDEVKEEIGVTRLTDAEFVVDVGFGVGNRDGYETVIEPLERAIRDLGVRSLVIGGSRKVTEELHLLPADRQIGQSGISVNPRIILAIGISGAPQHLNYIGPRATILAFNRDPEAPIMTLNQRQPRPRVFPVVGDLFDTVPAFIAALGKEPIRE